MASATTTNKLNLLKRLWGNKVSEPMYKASKLAAMCAKDTSFGGEGRYVIVKIGPTAGGSSNFADALASQDTDDPKRFFVTRKKEYQVWSVENEAILACRGDKNAVVDLLKTELGSARYAHSRAIAARFWAGAGGALGQLDSGVTLASTTLTLRSRPTIARFEPKMQLEFSSDDGTPVSPAGRRGLPDRLTVSTRNTRTGVITTSANLNTVTAITVNDYVFRRGDYANAMTGMQGWSPVSDPSGGESFFGTDRTLGDIQRLSGIRVSGSGAPYEETLQDAAAEAQLAGGEIDSYVCFVGPLTYAKILKEMGSERERQGKTSGDIGFTYIEVVGAIGTFKVVSEVDVPDGYGWMANPKQITLRTLGECPMLLAEGYPNQMLTAHDADAKQGRLGCYGNIFNEEPGTVVIITF